MTGKLELPGFSVKGITETDKSGENEVCSQAETLYFRFGLHVGKFKCLSLSKITFKKGNIYLHILLFN